MCSLRTRIRHRLATTGGPETGFTIVEVIVASALGLIVASASMYALTQGVNVSTRRQDRVLQLELSQKAVQRLVRDLRQATSLTYTSASSLSYTVPGVGAVTFTCSGTTCTRTVGGVGQTAITNVANPTTVFSALPSTTSPTYIGVSVQLTYPTKTSCTTTYTCVTVNDGAALRNVTLGS